VVTSRPGPTSGRWGELVADKQGPPRGGTVGAVMPRRERDLLTSGGDQRRGVSAIAERGTRDRDHNRHPAPTTDGTPLGLRRVRAWVVPHPSNPAPSSRPNHPDLCQRSASTTRLCQQMPNTQLPSCQTDSGPDADTLNPAACLGTTAPTGFGPRRRIPTSLAPRDRRCVPWRCRRYQLALATTLSARYDSAAGCVSRIAEGCECQTWVASDLASVRSTLRVGAKVDRRR
jgi:hypothetical protein